MPTRSVPVGAMSDAPASGGASALSSSNLVDAQKIIDSAAKPAKAAGLQVETGGQLGHGSAHPVCCPAFLAGTLPATRLARQRHGRQTYAALDVALSG